MEKIIKVNGLSFFYKNNKKILNDISFDVNQGEVFGFLGPNGSGKSTTQKILTGILKEYSGQVKVLGKEISQWDKSIYNQLSVLFEYPFLYSNLNAYDNLNYFSSFYPSNKCRNVDEVLDQLELKKDHRQKLVSSYSKGMRQRLSMARALIACPKILFLDEPTSGLDPSGAVLFRNIIKEEKDKATTIFLTTHNMYDAELLCDRVAFVAEGEVKAIDTPINYKEKYSKQQIIIKAKANNKMKEFIYSKDEIVIALKKLQEEGAEIISIHSEEPDLENIFIKITGKELAKNE